MRKEDLKEWLDNNEEIDKVISKVPLKIIFEVPKEFENDYTFDKFADCFNRVCTDLNTFKDGVSGRYERETMDMFFNMLPKIYKKNT